MKIWLLIIYGLLLAAACIAALYYFDIANVRVAIDALIAKIPADWTAQIGSLIQNNLTTIAAVAVPTVIGLVTFVRYKAELTAKKELLELNSKIQAEAFNADSVAANASSKVSSLQKELDVYKGDTTADSLQGRITKMLGEQEGLNSTIDTLNMQLGEAKKAPTQLVEQLWGKSGEQTIDVNGVLYRIINKETVIVK